MRIVLQRVKEARVEVEERLAGEDHEADQDEDQPGDQLNGSAHRPSIGSAMV